MTSSVQKVIEQIKKQIDFNNLENEEKEYIIANLPIYALFELVEGKRKPNEIHNSNKNK